jgi:hypothetical protein
MLRRTGRHAHSRNQMRCLRGDGGFARPFSYSGARLRQGYGAAGPRSTVMGSLSRPLIPGNSASWESLTNHIPKSGINRLV